MFVVNPVNRLTEGSMSNAAQGLRQEGTDSLMETASWTSGQQRKLIGRGKEAKGEHCRGVLILTAQLSNMISTIRATERDFFQSLSFKYE